MLDIQISHPLSSNSFAFVSSKAPIKPYLSLPIILNKTKQRAEGELTTCKLQYCRNIVVKEEESTDLIYIYCPELLSRRMNTSRSGMYHSMNVVHVAASGQFLLPRCSDDDCDHLSVDWKLARSS